MVAVILWLSAQEIYWTGSTFGGFETFKHQNMLLDLPFNPLDPWMLTTHTDCEIKVLCISSEGF